MRYGQVVCDFIYWVEVGSTLTPKFYFKKSKAYTQSHHIELMKN